MLPAVQAEPAGLLWASGTACGLPGWGTERICVSTPRVGPCLGRTGLSGVTDDTAVLLGLCGLGGPAHPPRMADNESLDGADLTSLPTEIHLWCIPYVGACIQSVVTHF